MAIEGFEEKVTEKMAEFEKALDMMGGARRMLVEDALWDYCCVAVQLDEVRANIVEVGFTVEDSRGKQVRNPDIMTQHQLLNEKNALLPKLLKALPDDAAKDVLAEFIARR